MSEPSKHPMARTRRQNRRIHELVHDPYRSKSKIPNPTVCPPCGAVFHAGRWTWMARPAGAREELCPACRRMRDKYPAGFLTLKGQFFREHRQEILNLARHEEQKTKVEHPLQRIMAIEEQEEGILLTTTDPHLARGIGEAVYRAYQGELDFRYVAESSMLPVSWTH